MTTSTSGDQPVPDPDHVFNAGDKLYVIREDGGRPHKVGDVLVVDTNDPADADDEISIDHFGYIRRNCVSLVPPPPLDTPPSLKPDDLERWLSS